MRTSTERMAWEGVIYMMILKSGDLPYIGQNYDHEGLILEDNIEVCFGFILLCIAVTYSVAAYYIAVIVEKDY